MEDEPLDPKTFFPWTVKYAYQPVFHVPNEPWRVDANWDEALRTAA